MMFRRSVLGLLALPILTVAARSGTIDRVMISRGTILITDGTSLSFTNVEDSKIDTSTVRDMATVKFVDCRFENVEFDRDHNDILSVCTGCVFERCFFNPHCR